MSAPSVLLPPTMRVFERGWLSSNNVLFTGDDGAVLIDSGYVTHAAQTLALVEHALDGRPLGRILNTHLHSDHCGGNAALQARYPCRTSVPATELAKVRAWDEEALTYKVLGQQCAPFRADDGIAAGDVFDLGGMAWHALGAAGHHAHQLLFYCPAQALLISADALWFNGLGVIFPELDGESGFAEARATLDMIADLDVRYVIPGHGAPFTDIEGALRRARSRLDFLEADPARNAEYAIKVTLKFLLIERQQIALDAIAALFASIPVIAQVRARYLDKSDEQLAAWAVQTLVRSGAARRASGMLINSDL